MLRAAPKRLVVIGGVAAGASVVAKARRESESLQISLFESGEYVSYATCGLPYFIGGTIVNRGSLLLSDARRFKARFNIDVYTSHRVVRIDRAKSEVVVEHNGVQRAEHYDRLGRCCVWCAVAVD